MKKIYAWEPWFFMFFGLFHLHRIWGLIDRKSYADFWLGILESKGVFYFVLMGILAFLCICGIVIFCRNIKNNYWWRWIYLFGGGYLLFDLFAIAIELKIWNWKYKHIRIPENMCIVHDNEYIQGNYQRYHDEPYFRLYHSLEDIQTASIKCNDPIYSFNFRNRCFIWSCYAWE